MEKKLQLFLWFFSVASVHFGCAMVLDKSTADLRCSWSDLPEGLKRDLEEITVPPVHFAGEELTNENRVVLDFLHRKYRRTYPPQTGSSDSSKRYCLELLLAAYNGDAAAVEKMIRAENISFEDIFQVIFIALKQGHVNILLLFPNEIKDGAAGLLIGAAGRGHLPVVQFIYERFNDALRVVYEYSSAAIEQEPVSMIDEEPGSLIVEKLVPVIDESVLLCAITLASISGHEDVVRFLCAFLPSHVSRGILAVYDGNMGGLESLHLLDGEDIKGHCLLVGVLRKHVPLLEPILSSGVSKKWIDLALKVATLTDCTPAVALLLSFEPREIERVEALRHALDQQNCDLVDLLTRQAGGSYARGYALRVASEKGSSGIVKMLLASGVTSQDAECALVFASTYGHEDIVGLLLASGLCDGEKDQAYAQAIVNGNVAISQLLLAAGAVNLESTCSAAVSLNSDLLDFRLGPRVREEDLIEKSMRKLESGSCDFFNLLEDKGAERDQFLSDCIHNAIIMRRFRALEHMLDCTTSDCEVDNDVLIEGCLALLELGKDSFAERLLGMCRSEKLLDASFLVLQSGKPVLLEKVLSRLHCVPDGQSFFLSDEMQEMFFNEALSRNYPLTMRLILFSTLPEGHSLTHSKIYKAIFIAQEQKKNEIVALLRKRLETKTRKQVILAARLILPYRYRRLKTLFPGAMSNWGRAALLQELEYDYDTALEKTSFRFQEAQRELYKLLLRDDVRDYSERRTARFPLLAVMRKQAEWKSYMADPHAFVLANAMKRSFANGQTCLIWAVMFNHKNVMKHLIERRLPHYFVNARDSHGNTALMYAAGLGNERMLRDLLDTGCCRYQFGENIKDDHNAIFEALVCAECNDHYAIVAKLLIYLAQHVYLM